MSGVRLEEQRRNRARMVATCLREAAHKIETLAYRDIARAIRESAEPDLSLYAEALRLFRAHVAPRAVRAFRHGHTTAETAAELRIAATAIVLGDA